MSEQLYRTTPRVLDGGHSHVINGIDSPCVICGAERRWVVPVTIDYEAAAEKLGEFAISLLTDPIENDAEWVKVIVDAASGGQDE